MTEVLVSRAMEIMGTRLGDKDFLEQWAQQCLSFCHSRCHFCGEEYKTLHIDWDDKPKPTALCCEQCWNLRRLLPYTIVKNHARSLNSGQKRFCGGEWHDTLEDGVQYISQFEPRCDLCRQCMQETTRKRRVNWQEYADSWRDAAAKEPKNWRNQ